MRKLLPLVGVLAMGVSSLQASVHAATADKNYHKTDKKTSATAVDHSVCSKHMVSFDPEEIATSVWARYLGGFVSPINMVIAQDGAHATTATTNAQKDFIAAEANWTNGFDAGFLTETGSGHHFGASFRFMMNTANKKGSITKASTYDDLVPAFGTNSLGNGERITSANGNYGLNGIYEAKVYAVHPVVTANGVYCVAQTGVTGGYMKHNSTANYTLYSDASEQKLYQEDKLSYGGPHATLFVAKEFSDSVLLYGSVGGSARGAANNHTATSNNHVESVDQGADVNTKGDLYNLIQTVEASLGVAWAKELDNDGSVALTAGWEGAVHTNGTRLFSNVSGVGANQTQDMAFGLLNVGVSLRY